MRKISVSHFLILVAGVLLLASYVGGGQRQSDQKEKVPTLERGRVIESEMAMGDAHSYQVTLQVGEVLSAVVEQRGIDVRVTVIGPEGKKLADVDSPNGTQGPELIEVTATVAGIYRLEIRPLGATVARGRYAVKIAEQLPPEQLKERVAERTRAEEVKKWLAEHAIPLQGVEAGRGFEDLQPLKKLIGPARLVALGEATHGTREFFQLKHRILEFLVSEMGFTVFGMEATMPEAFDVNEYVLTGNGDPAMALAGLGFSIWDTQEVLEMIRWMRRYNADPRHEKKVKFYGFDMQSPTRAAKVALAYLHKVDPEPPAEVVKTLAPQANPFLASVRSQPAVAVKKAAAAAKTLLERFDQLKPDYVRRSSASEWAIARQHARVLAQSLERAGLAPWSPARTSARDRVMADNIHWILEHEGPGAKMVIWAHNGHVSTTTDGPVEMMGSHLRKRYGADMIVFGFGFNQGSFRAVEMPLDSGKGPRTFEVRSAPEGSLDAILAAGGLKIAAVNLRAVPGEGPVAAWFSQPRASRYIGFAFGEQFADSFLKKQKVPLLYDALLFVETTTASRPNPTASRGGTQKLVAPANLDFERGDPGKPPADWRLPSGVNSASYDVVTSEDNPDSGKHCAMIRRTPGPHYGETFGSLAQWIDARPYEGQRIKLRAAVRTEVAGAGNQAHLWLRVHKKGDGLASVAFSDVMADRPITSKVWRVFEIVGNVPKDAETISFGLALVGEGKAWLDSVSLEAVER